jgi:hypothetical protein
MRDLAADREIINTATIPIPGFTGYEVDEQGNIWSVSHNWRGYGKRKLTPFVDKYGYYKVRMTIDGTRYKRPIHRLVCFAYHGKPTEDKNIVRHLNGVKSDNRPGNLCWGTQQENEQDSVRLKEKASGDRNGAVKYSDKVSKGVKRFLKQHPEKIIRGENHYKAKVTNEQAREMQERFNNGETAMVIAKEMGLNYQTTYAICKGRRYANA